MDPEVKVNNTGGKKNTSKCRLCAFRLCVVIALISAIALYQQKTTFRDDILSVFQNFPGSLYLNDSKRAETKEPTKFSSAKLTSSARPKAVSSRISSNETRNKTSLEKPIVVLAWSALHSGTPWEVINPPLFKNCPRHLNCIVTSDRKRFNQSSAVLFHLTTSHWRDPTPFRRPDQYYVFALWEAPTHASSGSLPKDFFNLTMTYRRDSDVFWPYGSLRQRRSPFAENESVALEKSVRGKTKLVAWMVSACRTSSKREQYVHELKKHIPVDVYGACGSLKCPRDPKQSSTTLGTKHWKPCESMLGEKYKFYLSFENSVCRDYVTEKFFQRMDNAFLVPVVLERAIVLNAAFDEETRKVLNESFVAADDFDTPRQLADYLKYLDKDTTAYLRYFEWRRAYEVQFEEQLKPGCELCRLVKEGRRRMVKDIKSWWTKEANCHALKQKWWPSWHI